MFEARCVICSMASAAGPLDFEALSLEEDDANEGLGKIKKKKGAKRHTLSCPPSWLPRRDAEELLEWFHPS